MSESGDGFTGTTHLAVVLDKSGSMGHLAQEVISGFNQWLADQKALPGRALLTLTLFDTAVETPIAGVEVANVNDLDSSRYVPGGMTALYDAVHKSVQAMTVPPEDRALVLVITDGEENSSKECNKAQVRALISEKEALGNWTFTYLSAAPDAFADGAAAGVGVRNTRSYQPTPQGTKAAFAGMRGSTTTFRASAGLATQDFYGDSAADPSGAPPVAPPPVVGSVPAAVAGSPWVGVGGSEPKTDGRTAWTNQ